MDWRVISSRANSTATNAAALGVDEVQHVVVDDPAASSVAPSALSTSAPRSPPRRLRASASDGIEAERRRRAPPSSARADTGQRAFERHRAGRAGGTRRSVVTRNVRRPHALPISLATVSLAPATSAATNATRMPGRARRSARSSAPRSRRRRVRDRVARRRAVRRALPRCRARACAQGPAARSRPRRRNRGAAAPIPASRRQRMIAVPSSGAGNRACRRDRPRA